MTLIRNSVFVTDTWRLVSGDERPNDVEMLIWPLARIEDAYASGASSIGVEVDNTLRPRDLEAHLPRLSLVSIVFPAFTDGRGFSLARGLRMLGFVGELRAHGPIIADQSAHMLACGFDSIEIPDALAFRQPAAQWGDALDSLSLSYQRGYARGISILDQRRMTRNRERASQVAPELRNADV